MSEPIVVEFTVTASTVAGAIENANAKAETLFGDIPYEISSLKGEAKTNSFTWSVTLTELRANEPEPPEPPAPAVNLGPRSSNRPELPHNMPLGNILGFGRKQ